ncbi:hypothetical protein L6R52_27465 [Myxococcota bacterium]|nr:hypothetical protein [Myxococcota bacterium]
MNVLVLMLTLLAEPTAGEPAPPRAARVYTAWTLFPSTWLDLGLEHPSFPAGAVEDYPIDEDRAPGRLAGNASGLRQIFEAAYAPSEELSFNVGIDLSAELDAALVKLIGGVRYSSLVVHTELSRLSGAVHPQTGVLFEPGTRTFSGRLIQVFVGYDWGGDGSEMSVPMALGASLMWIEQPQVLRVGTEKRYPPVPETALDLHFQSLGAFFALDIDSLKGLLRGDARQPMLFELAEAGPVRIGMAFDLNLRIGVTVESISGEAEEMITRLTGRTVRLQGSPRVGPALGYDLRGGVVLGYAIAGVDLGLQLGYQAGGLHLWGFNDATIDERAVSTTEIVATPVVGHSYYVHGPTLRLGAVF